MASIYREWRVAAASAFAVAAIVGAYFLARNAAMPPIAEAATESAVLQQIATKDSNGDGLPDWEKSLYGIPLDATTTDYFHLGMTDGEAVAKGLIVPIAATPVVASSTPSQSDTAASFGLTAPQSGSLTDTFAQNFFSLYLSAEQNAGGSLTDDQINTLANQALTQLSESITPAPNFKTAEDINVSGSGAAALKTYAANAEAIFAAHEPNVSETDLSYLSDAASNNNPSDLTALGAIAASYQDIAIGLSALPVPEEAASADLALINALARMGEIDSDFSNVSSDPLTAMLSLEQYPQTLTALSNAFTEISSVYSAENVVIPPGTPGSFFVNSGGSL